MCYGRDRDTQVVSRVTLRRLFKLQEDVRQAIDGADLEAAFRVQADSPYDQGRYDGMMAIAMRVYNVLPKEDAPFD